MGNTTAAAITTPGTEARTLTLGRMNVLKVPFTCNLSSSYATGGDTFIAPTSLRLDMWKLFGINIYDSITGGYILDWNGSTSAPKIQAFVGANGPEVITGMFPAVATAGNDDTTFSVLAPFAGTISNAQIAANAAYTGATPNGRNWTLQNITQSFTDVATFTGTGSGAAFNLAAGTPKAMVLGAAAHLVVAANDQLNFVSTHTGTGLADPGGTFSYVITPTTGGATEAPSGTNLSTVKVTGEALYWN